MRRRWRRTLALVALTGGGTLLTTGAGPACQAFAANQALATTDFCFLFDCQNGAIGGLIDFCSLSTLEEPLFTDCPQFLVDNNP